MKYLQILPVMAMFSMATCSRAQLTTLELPSADLTYPMTWIATTTGTWERSADGTNGPKLIARVEKAGVPGTSVSVLMGRSRSEKSGIAEFREGERDFLQFFAGSQGLRVEELTVQDDANGADAYVRWNLKGTGPKGESVELSLVSQRPASEDRPVVRMILQRAVDDEAAKKDLAVVLTKSRFFGVAVPEGLRTQDGALASAAGVEIQSTGSTDGSASSSSAPSAEAGDLVNRYRDALIIVDSKSGKGSAFLCRMGKEVCLVTNAHVMAAAESPRFLTLNGSGIKGSSLSVAVGHDLFRVGGVVKDNAPAPMENVDANAKVGDEIAVLGNSEGAGVIHPVEGRIVGIGPNLIEVDAAFVPGNSGSPIVHKASGKIVGVATYLRIKKVSKSEEKQGNDSENFTEEIRRFGYRLDSVTSWEPVEWRRFTAQATQVRQIENFSRAFSGKETGNFPQEMAIERAWEAYSKAIKSPSVSMADKTASARHYLGILRSAARNDINAFDSRNAYDYFRRTVQDEKEFRDAVCEMLTKAIDQFR